MIHPNHSTRPPTRREKWIDIGKTVATIVFCTGFLAYALAIMFLMPAGAR